MFGEEKHKEICNNKIKITEALNSLYEIKQITDSGNKIARIILEETIAVNWLKIKGAIKMIKELLPVSKKTILWKIPRTKKLIRFIEQNLDETKKSPCKFVDFMEKIINQDDFDENIQFFKYLVNDDLQCKRVFENINYNK